MDASGLFSFRVASRRAAFRNALRDGDVAGAARAASRLLVVAPELDPATGQRIRDARARLGHGLRLARRRRAIGPVSLESTVADLGAARGQQKSTNRRWPLAAMLTLIALLLTQLVPTLRPAAPEEGGAMRVKLVPPFDE